MAMAMETGLVGDSKSFLTHEAMECGNGYQACLVGEPHANPWSMAMAMEASLVGDLKLFVAREAMERSHGPCLVSSSHANRLRIHRAFHGHSGKPSRLVARGATNFEASLLWEICMRSHECEAMNFGGLPTR